MATLEQKTVDLTKLTDEQLRHAITIYAHSSKHTIFAILQAEAIRRDFGEDVSNIFLKTALNM